MVVSQAPGNQRLGKRPVVGRIVAVSRVLACLADTN
jgi:hypothetical protein